MLLDLVDYVVWIGLRSLLCSIGVSVQVKSLDSLRQSVLALASLLQVLRSPGFGSGHAGGSLLEKEDVLLLCYFLPEGLGDDLKP